MHDLLDPVNFRGHPLANNEQREDVYNACYNALVHARVTASLGKAEFSAPLPDVIHDALERFWRETRSNDLIPVVEAAIDLLLACNEVLVEQDSPDARDTRLFGLSRISLLEKEYPIVGRVGLKLLARAKNTVEAREGAYAFHHEVENLLTYLFSPALRDPRRERKLADGRKRVDIVYTNEATAGFFRWVQNLVHSPFIYVEVKNYAAGNDPRNPEFDQLSGRLNPSRGLLGILVCREIADRSLTLARARDIQRKGEYVVALDLTDLERLAREAHPAGERDRFPLLFDRFRELVE